MIEVLILAFVQNVSFTLVSRSRNRDSKLYHGVCSVFSNLTWFLTMRELVLTDLTWALLPAYLAGTVAGSLAGQSISIKVEKLIGASV